MPEVELCGCRPEPLMSYLKALGVFRIVAEQEDHSARAAWVNDRFILRSKLDAAELVAFLLDRYTPAPLVAPWAGGSGFFENDDRSAVNALAGSSVTRLGPYRSVIEKVHRILAGKGITANPSKMPAIKADLIRTYRTQLPDDFVRWMDSVLVLQPDGQIFPPILGTGGNDGRQNFTQNFMQRLVDVGICHQANPEDRQRRQSEKWLRQALFGELASGLLSESVGQFHPGGVGGPNSTQGMEGDSLVNPWEFIMMIEGAVVMSGTVARRLGAHAGISAAFPFTVMPASVGQQSLSQSDGTTTRSETWLPLWEHYTTLPELKLVFSEGRAEAKGRQCRDGVEFARAVASLGVDRGFSGFVRYAFVKRSGKAYLAAPLGRMNVAARPTVELLSELERDGWLESFRRACGSTKPAPPPRFPVALRRLHSAAFDVCRYGGKSRFADVLAALGRIERELAILPGEKIAGRVLRPVPMLSAQWLAAANDGTPEFRVAAALASISESPTRGEDTGGLPATIGPLRTNLESVVRGDSRYVWTKPTGSVVWTSGNLSRNLAAVLARRMMEADRRSLAAVPLDAGFGVASADIALFIDGLIDDKRIEELLWGTMLVGRPDLWPSLVRAPTGTDRSPLPLSRSYALLKLLFLPQRQALRSVADKSTVRAEPAIVDLLRTGSLAGALETATRRLRSAGFSPMPGPLAGGRHRPIFDTIDVDPLRLCAALVIPATNIVELKRMILREEQPA